MPFQSAGCTMECCLLGDWAAPRRVAAYEHARSHADTAFVLEKGDSVSALSQHVQTTAPGSVVAASTLILQVMRGGDTAVSSLSIQAGDTVYTTSLSPEATDVAFWYKGHSYSAAEEFQVFGLRRASTRYPYNVLSLPAVEWWVKVRNRTGAEGWILDPSYFEGAGRCG